METPSELEQELSGDRAHFRAAKTGLSTSDANEADVPADAKRRHAGG
jgi:hypothetical protein